MIILSKSFNNQIFVKEKKPIEEVKKGKKDGNQKGR
jgi:hypothetical protein